MILFKYLAKLWWVPVLLLLFWFVGRQVNLFPSFPNPFKEKPLEIAQTPVLIKEVKDISELFTINYFEEVAVQATRKVKTSTTERAIDIFTHDLDFYKEQDIVLIARGNVYAGFDLSGLGEQDIIVVGKKITVFLPQPKILDVVVNPSGYETFEEEGNWSNAQVKMVKRAAKKKLRTMALQNGILEQSKKSGTATLRQFFTGLGFEEVEIIIVKDELALLLITSD